MDRAQDGKVAPEWALRVTMADGSVWAVPVMVIARDRAAAYAIEFEGDIERSINEDTLPLFRDDAYSIKDWAANNMNWDDVCLDAVQVQDPVTPAPDFQECWVNGDKEVTGTPPKAPADG